MKLSNIIKEVTAPDDKLQQVKDEYKKITGKNLTDSALIKYAKEQIAQGRIPFAIATFLYAFGPQNEVMVKTKTKFCPHCKAAHLKYDTDSKAFYCDRCEKYSEPQDVHEDLPPRGGSGEGLTKNPNQTELNEGLERVRQLEQDIDRAVGSIIVELMYMKVPQSLIQKYQDQYLFGSKYLRGILKKYNAQ